MKILYLIHQFYPEFQTGTEKIFLNVITMMQKYGHKVKVMTYSSYEDSFYDQSVGTFLVKSFLYKGIEVLALKHRDVPADVHYALGNENLSAVAAELIRRENPDLVHIGHPMRVSELGRVLPSLNLPYVVTLTDFFFICPKYTLLTSQSTLCDGPERGSVCQTLCPELPLHLIRDRLDIAGLILLNAGAVTSLSGFLARIVQKEFRDLSIRVISPGLRYSTLKRRVRVYGSNDALVFCYAGSLNFHKGVHIVIEAFKRVHSLSAVLKIYGSGTDKGYIERLTAMAKDDERIQFCGTYSEDKVGEMLAETDVVVVPSLWYETYCLVLHESLACNVPVIASDIGIMAEKITHGVNGFVFPLADFQSLGQTIQGICDHPSELNNLKTNINDVRIPAVEQESYAYERLYNRVLANFL